MNFLKGLLLTCLILLQACHYKNLKGGDAGDLNSGLGAEQIDFAFVMKEVIAPKCLECHRAGGTASFLPFEIYAQIKPHGADIKDSVSDDYMPKNRAALTAAQKQILNSWIDAGLPETISAEPAPKPEVPPVVTEPNPTPTPVPPIEPPAPLPPARDWLTVRSLVLEPACLRCHSAPANRAGVNLETYQNTFSNIAAIDTVVRDGSMPIRGTLTQEQKDLILEWIQAGAPEFATP